jgi:hypothetical protein
MAANRAEELARIARLAELRRRNRTVPTAYLAAKELVRLRGDFGDWCWLAWYACARKEYEEATYAIERALERRPGHEQATALASQILEERTAAAEAERERVAKAQLAREAQLKRLHENRRVSMVWPSSLAWPGENSLNDSLPG